MPIRCWRREFGNSLSEATLTLAVTSSLQSLGPFTDRTCRTSNGDIARRPDWRIKAALAALPYVHANPERSPATDPAATARQIEGGSDSDPLADAIEAWRRAANDCDRIEKSREGSKVNMYRKRPAVPSFQTRSFRRNEYEAPQRYESRPHQ